jgi:hypothetical protein
MQGQMTTEELFQCCNALLAQMWKVVRSQPPVVSVMVMPQLLAETIIASAPNEKAAKEAARHMCANIQAEVATICEKNKNAENQNISLPGLPD